MHILLPSTAALTLLLFHSPSHYGGAGFSDPPAPAKKCVVFDPGHHWPCSLDLRTDGSVDAVANPRLVPGSEPLAVQGINDLARLDAMQPGAGDRMVLVGAAGVQVVGHDSVAGNWTISSWTEPNLAGGTAIRAKLFGTQWGVAVLGSDHMTMRCYRFLSGPFLVGTWTLPQPVLDFEFVTTASGVARLLTLTAGELRCSGIGGNTIWSVASGGGELVPFAGSSTANAAWLRPGAGSNWEAALCGDNGLVEVSPIGGITSAESLKALMAADADGDHDTDLIAKFNDRLVVVANTGAAPAFAGATVSTVQTFTGSEACVADLASLQHGEQLYVVDELASQGLQWTDLTTASPSLALTVESAGQFSTITALPETNQTEVEFFVDLQPALLAAFPESQAQAIVRNLQFTVWHSAGPGVRTEIVAERNLVMPIPNSAATRFSIRLPLNQQLLANTSGMRYWGEPAHYWVTARLCRTVVGSTTEIDASTAVRLGLTLRTDPLNPNFTYLLNRPGSLEVRNLYEAGPLGPSFLGGGVVGVVNEYPEPPPSDGVGNPTPPVSDDGATGH